MKLIKTPTLYFVFKELQSLGESIGTESKGLSDDVIGFLPSHSYKTGLFSRKQKQK